jgi:hypothetical protein
MPSPLPLTDDPAKLRLELKLCPACDREDAMQEAWLASLEGRRPHRAVNTFAQRERRYRQRVRASGCAQRFGAGRGRVVAPADLRSSRAR